GHLTRGVQLGRRGAPETVEGDRPGTAGDEGLDRLHALARPDADALDEAGDPSHGAGAYVTDQRDSRQSGRPFSHAGRAAFTLILREPPERPFEETHRRNPSQPLLLAATRRPRIRRIGRPRDTRASGRLRYLLAAAGALAPLEV